MTIVAGYIGFVLLGMACVVAMVDLWVKHPRRTPTYLLTQATPSLAGVLNALDEHRNLRRASAAIHTTQPAATALLRRFLDWDRALKRLDELNSRVEDSTLWDDPKAAQEVMRERRRLDEAIGATRAISSELEDTISCEDIVLMIAARSAVWLRGHISRWSSDDGAFSWLSSRRVIFSPFVVADRLLGFLFEQLDKHRVTAACDPRNLPSVRVLEAVGMRREGHLVESTWSKPVKRAVSWKSCSIVSRSTKRRRWRSATRSSRP